MYCNIRLISINILFFGLSILNAAPPWQMEDNCNVALIAPSGRVNFEVINVFRESVKRLGLESELPEDMQSSAELVPYGYYANTDVKRMELFVLALESPVIWSLRGGYGTQPLVRSLQSHSFDDIDFSRKLLIGFSDSTLLGIWFNKIKGGHFLHGPMYYCTETAEVSGAKIGSHTSLQKVCEIITGTVTEVQYTIHPINQLAYESEIDSSILGGNLSVIQRNLSGLLRNIDWSENILFLEDTPEDVKRLENILYGLFDTGRFSDIKAIIFGSLPIDESCKKEFFSRFDSFNRHGYKRIQTRWKSSDTNEIKNSCRNVKSYWHILCL